MRPARALLSWLRTCLPILTFSAAALCSRRALTQPALYSYLTIAGDEGVGSSDGTNKDIRFYSPAGIVCDRAGNLFISDRGNYTIRKLTSVGTNWVSSTIAGHAGFRGSADGTNSDARFEAPDGIALDGSGNLLVADAVTIRKLAPVGTNWVVSTVAGQPEAYGTADGTNGDIRFSWPSSIAVNSEGEVFVADSLRLRKLVQEGTNWISSTVGLHFYLVTSVSFDRSDQLYVASAYGIGNDGNHGVVELLTQLGTNWTAQPLPIPPDGNYGTFKLSAAAAGRIFVAKDNDTIWQSTLTGTNWVWSQVAGQSGGNTFGLAGSADGTNSAALFRGPVGMTLDSAGNLFVADSGNHAIRKITLVGSDWVTATIAGHPPSTGSADGTNQAAHFSSPHGVVVDSSGTVFVADTGAHAIRETDHIGQDWITHTIAGTLDLPGTADGTNSNARLNSPYGLALGGPGALYVSDPANNSIRRLQRVGTNWVTSTIAGVPGLPGSQDGTNDGIRFSGPYDIAVDTAGHVFVAEGDRLRKLTSIGTNWVSSTLFIPAGRYVDAVATGKNGELYITDSGAIYEVAASGTNAVLNKIVDYDTAEAMAVDSDNNLVAVDNDRHGVQKAVRLGTNWVAYIIGGGSWYSGYIDGTNRDALFQGPSAMAVDNSGNLYVTDGNVLRLGMRVSVAPPIPITRQSQLMDGTFMFAWNASPGLDYQIQYTSTLDQPTWINLGSPVMATNELLSASDPPVQQQQRFYRVVLLP